VVILFEHGTGFVKNVTQMIGGKIVTEAEQLAKKNFVALAKIFQYGGCDCTVGDRDYRALLGTQFGGTKANVFYNAALIADAAGIADDQGLVGEDGNAAEQIFESFLSAEADGQTADAEAGESRGNIDAEPAEYNQRGEDKNYDLKNAAR
jgi:hypothetical protein